MKEAFKKIRAELGEYIDEYSFLDEKGLHSERWCAMQEALAVVNQVEEEYKGGWIPFKQREMTEEEKAVYGEDCKYMLDCKLPDDDEEILVTYKWKDEFYVGNDTFLKDGNECYLDTGREFITEAIAWRPLPEPYKGEQA